MDRLFGGVADARLDYDNIPTVLFSHPPLVTVGLTAESARELHGDDVHEYRADYRATLHALADMPQRRQIVLFCTGPAARVVGDHRLADTAHTILLGTAGSSREVHT